MYLGYYFRAIGSRLNHASNSLNLPLNPIDPRERGFMVGTSLSFVIAILFHNLLEITRYQPYHWYIPHGGIMQQA